MTKKEMLYIIAGAIIGIIGLVILNNTWALLGVVIGKAMTGVGLLTLVSAIRGGISGGKKIPAYAVTVTEE